MAPLSMIDYTIVHELCHLIYPHHSTEFWQKVESIIPNYKKRRDWLKDFSFQIDTLV
jgi:predicted metal-dependent hydrolase